MKARVKKLILPQPTGGSPVLMLSLSARPQVAGMPREEVASLWKAYLQAFAASLLQMHGDGGSAAGRQLVRCRIGPVQQPRYLETLYLQE